MVKEVAGIPLPEHWWSRPYEYCWAMQFGRRDHHVLDAACGMSHPFKWWLAEHRAEVWACDLDPRILSKLRILLDTHRDLGSRATRTLVQKMRLFWKVRFLVASIDDLPAGMPRFDAIYCISVLEHLSEEERARTLRSFARQLAPGGTVVLTVDVPDVSIEELLSASSAAGLKPRGDVFRGPPPQDAISREGLLVYRLLLQHDEAAAAPPR